MSKWLSNSHCNIISGLIFQHLESLDMRHVSNEFMTKVGTENHVIICLRNRNKCQFYVSLSACCKGRQTGWFNITLAGI